MKHLIVAAAGTGGHVMPGLAVADVMRQRGWSVSWLGTVRGLERQWVQARGFDFDALDFSSMRGKGVLNLLRGTLRLLRAGWRAWRVLRQRRTTVLFSTGGYVAVPTGWAAACARVPLVLLNADAAPLLSTRLLRPVTRALLCGFEGEAARRCGGRVIGNPVRAQIAQVPAPAARFAGRTGPLRVLVIGGSLGAQVLNEVVPQALALLPPGQSVEVVHQCGAQHVQSARNAYAQAGVRAEVLSFIDDMAARYTWADVVLCRAGAITVAELCAAGVASVLVPFIASTTAHQRNNAQGLAQQGAALHLPQTELTPQRLSAQLQTLTRERLLAMAQAARALGHADAAQKVADAIEQAAGAALETTP